MRKDLRRTAAVYVPVGAAAAAALVALAVVQGFPLLLLGMTLLGVALVVVPAVVGVTNEGIETTAASTRIGFDAGDPNQYRPSRLPVPSALEVVCALSGAGIVGLVVVAATA
jgi:hypothetical protein